MQNLIVALIVVLAALYALWRLMPRTWKRAAAGKVAAGSQRAGLVDDEGAQKLAASLAKSGSCGSCDSCGSCGPAKPAPSTGANEQPLTRVR